MAQIKVFFRGAAYVRNEWIADAMIGSRGAWATQAEFDKAQKKLNGD